MLATFVLIILYDLLDVKSRWQMERVKKKTKSHQQDCATHVEAIDSNGNAAYQMKERTNEQASE